MLERCVMFVVGVVVVCKEAMVLVLHRIYTQPCHTFVQGTATMRPDEIRPESLDRTLTDHVYVYARYSGDASAGVLH